ncbi:NAD/NADP transhydrogenase alpha subunit [Paenibacillus apiarius]|uniref:NAD/NADP transhydrogenase alpha subunit n=1 Tax=Paenibacillus apiarius TaxID=46240 RepID=A0ABT4DTS4_9BACL|nr:NAD/NADP transhydrogenase alpha subunit [Paenibacillus apiarius]MBN3527547.1 NAD/NADP transhydrogenase alpha subunit [Paenibacillus apiarius]MCY9515847.1 NAD/NADP transhydrogenase alpha subunit [Paenibacillus apiarius]MCY9520757.1 NAD/NADP transhydrogenase alpha subunit [Paenibacillus apiarius]MCY9553461.1 NAD/NADP transhydrogenase alpha subunit [Paenibacillus apiarius]MCY9558015.1 NAD/NADP transhydrogenase alpha subunit [Paenibacillus apiarius]
MKCISVYTNDFEQFSDIYEKVIQTPLQDDEEREIDGITIYGAGEVPEQYVERMRQKRDVVVMRVKDQDITILQHGEQFEIILPKQQNMVH